MPSFTVVAGPNASGKSTRTICVSLFGYADQAILYDNSTSVGFTKVATKANGQVELFEPLPSWAAFLREGA
jgi:predicted ABC-type ATPase